MKAWCKLQICIFQKVKHFVFLCGGAQPVSILFFKRNRKTRRQILAAQLITPQWKNLKWGWKILSWSGSHPVIDCGLDAYDFIMHRNLCPLMREVSIKNNIDDNHNNWSISCINQLPLCFGKPDPIIITRRICKDIVRKYMSPQGWRFFSVKAQKNMFSLKNVFFWKTKENVIWEKTKKRSSKLLDFFC